jgi:hypothetical protein
LAQDEILGLKPRSPREPRPHSKQQFGQKRNHRPLLTIRPPARHPGLGFRKAQPDNSSRLPGSGHRRADRQWLPAAELTSESLLRDRRQLPLVWESQHLMLGFSLAN